MWGSPFFLLGAELKRVRRGETITVVDRTVPVARLSPIPDELRVTRAAGERYEYRPLDALTTRDPLRHLDAERGDSW